MFKAILLGTTLIATPSALAAQEISQFDLKCSGTKTEIGAKGQEPIAWTNHYRFDLSTNTWCAGECTQTMAMKAVSEQKISVGNATIDRVTGNLMLIYVDPLSSKAFRIEARCEPSAFSGFPQKLF